MGSEVRAADLVPGGRRGGFLGDAGFRRLFGALEEGPRRVPGSGEAARLAGRCPSTFKRAFARLTGRSWRGFVREWRLREARRRLGEVPADPVKRVALQVGWTDARSFARAYRARFGYSPRETRFRGGPEPEESGSGP